MPQRARLSFPRVAEPWPDPVPAFLTRPIFHPCLFQKPEKPCPAIRQKQADTYRCEEFQVRCKPGIGLAGQMEIERPHRFGKRDGDQRVFPPINEGKGASEQPKPKRSRKAGSGLDPGLDISRTTGDCEAASVCAHDAVQASTDYSVLNSVRRLFRTAGFAFSCSDRSSPVACRPPG